jgi:hypothetical protein
MKYAWLVTLLAAVVACTEVDTSELPPLDGYRDWLTVEATGKVGGHGDSFRIIYVNAEAASYAGAAEYPLGSVLVKEIFDERDGNLKYVAIMRRLAEAPSGGEIQGGWLFTQADEVGATEIQGFTCWDGCHVQAPYAGAWLDYGVVSAAAGDDAGAY